MASSPSPAKRSWRREIAPSCRPAIAAISRSVRACPIVLGSVAGPWRRL
jgi:hypothetical protein